ncbi:MAG: hypothetical protein LH614_09200 [Pyrinomonadaceae bacterium]|nr:hypothetical protein [Pyrinomonadaceae bacterium]
MAAFRARLLSRTLKYVKMTIAKPQDNNIITPIISESDGKNLASQIEELKSKHGFWSNASIWFTAGSVITPIILYFFGSDLPAVWLIALGAISPTLYFFSVWLANRRGIKLNEAQAALIREKDERFSRDLKDKDLQIAETVREAAQANERTQNVEQQNLQLKSDLGNARRYLQQVRSLQTPRSLRNGKFAQALKNRPVGAIDVTWAGDFFIGEPKEFAQEIINALTEAEWTIANQKGVIVISDEETAGLRIVVKNSNKPPNRAVTLYHALSSSGFIVDLIENEKYAEDFVSLLVLCIPADGGWILSFPE